MKIRNWKLKIRNCGGFTLIEVLVAMFVLVMGALGVFGLISRTITFNSSVNSQLVASYLSQEGLEIVRNIRDANFLKIHKIPGWEGAWNDGLTSCAAGCGANYNSISLDPALDLEPIVFNGSFYVHDAVADSGFMRVIKVIPGGGDLVLCPSGNDEKICVSVDVSWQDKDSTRTVTGATELYNWLTPAP